MTQLYDTIGSTYQDHRRPDVRIAAAIARALGNAQTVVTAVFARMKRTAG